MERKAIWESDAKETNNKMIDKEWPSEKEKAAIISRVEEVEDALDNAGYDDTDDFENDQAWVDKWRVEQQEKEDPEE